MTTPREPPRDGSGPSTRYSPHRLDSTYGLASGNPLWSGLRSLPIFAIFELVETDAELLAHFSCSGGGRRQHNPKRSE